MQLPSAYQSLAIYNKLFAAVENIRKPTENEYFSLAAILPVNTAAKFVQYVLYWVYFMFVGSST